MRIGKIILLNMLFVLLLSIGVNAAQKYMVDEAKVLKQETINTVEENLSKIEKNTEVVVKIDIVKSLNGKSIDDYAKQYAKDNISGEQYILFVTSVADKKNKILVGSKANSILSKSDQESIASLPNQDYKANNFDAGIIKVGKAIDEKVTTKAVKTGNAEVVKDDYSTKVQHKTSYGGVATVITVLIIVGLVIFIFLKGKANSDYENKKRKFAQDNNLDYDNNSFRSGDVNGRDRTTYSSSNNNSNYSEPNRDSGSRMHDNSYAPNGNSTVNNTTIIHENNDNKFVEGMMVGSMLSHNGEHHHHHDDDYYDHHENHGHHDYDNGYGRTGESNYDDSSSYNNDSTTYTSGDWNDDSSTSSWGSSSDDSSSSWDSGSDSGSSDW